MIQLAATENYSRLRRFSQHERVARLATGLLKQNGHLGFVGILMTTERAYFVRYGAMHHVGRFAAEDAISCRRGDVAVVRSYRGEELGEVLGENNLTYS